MMRQYQRIRAGLPADVLLFFRLGDFYELFFEDAKVASPILNVTLTQTPGHADVRRAVPRGGAVTFQQAHPGGQTRRHLRTERATCSPGKLVEREVTQVLSAGTVNQTQLLDAGRNHYLAAACFRKGGLRVCLPRPDHGRAFRVTELADGGRAARRTGAGFPGGISRSADDPAQAAGVCRISRGTQPYDAHAFGFEQADFTLREHFPRAVARRLRLREPAPGGERGGGNLPLSCSTRCGGRWTMCSRCARTVRKRFWCLDQVSQAHLEIVRAADGGWH